MSDRHRPELALSEPMAPPGQKNWNNKQVRLAQVIALTLAALILSKNHADPDFWGHVRYGQDLLNEGLPDSATYSCSNRAVFGTLSQYFWGQRSH